MRKPEARIYRHVLQELQVRPEQTVFLDDMGNQWTTYVFLLTVYTGVNLKAAKQLGINTIKVPYQSGGVAQALYELQDILQLSLKSNY